MTTVSNLVSERARALAAREDTVDKVINNGCWWFSLNSIALHIQFGFPLLFKVINFVFHQAPPLRATTGLFLPFLRINITPLHVPFLNILKAQELAALFPPAVLEFREEDALCHSYIVPSARRVHTIGVVAASGPLLCRRH